MKKLLSLMLILVSIQLSAQDIVFSKNVKADTIRPVKGPNLKHFSQSYLALSFPVYTNEELNYTIPGITMVFDYGIRYKRRINNTFAVGGDISVNWAAYRIKEGKGKSVPDSTINKRSKFKVNSISPDIYIRINVGRRGNIIGNYLDLGAYGSLNWKLMHKAVNLNEDDELVSLITTRLSYMETGSYGLLARLGTNRLALTAKYRLSNLFSKSSGLPELPRFSAGLELGLFKN